MLRQFPDSEAFHPEQAAILGFGDDPGAAGAGGRAGVGEEVLEAGVGAETDGLEAIPGAPVAQAVRVQGRRVEPLEGFAGGGVSG